MVHTCNPSTQELEAGGPQVQAYEARPVYMNIEIQEHAFNRSRGRQK